MKTTEKILLAVLALTASAGLILAQDDGQQQPPAGDQRPPAPRAHGRLGHRPPPPPVMVVLDANHDGVLDATEIANASKALLTLDKNGDGKLTQDELRPPRPEGGMGPGPGMPPGANGGDDHQGPPPGDDQPGPDGN